MTSARLIVLVIMIVVWIALELWKRARIRGAARRIADNLEASLQPDHVFHPVRPENFPWLTRTFYDEAQRDIETAGFEWLADIEDALLSQVHPDMRTFVRICVSPDHKTRAAIYEIVPGGPQGKATRPPIQTCELISEVSDGTTLITTTAPVSRLMDRPDGLVRNHLPPMTRLSVMLSHHEGTLATYLGSHPLVTLLEIHTFEEATAAWQKGIDRQRQRLEANGGISRAEFVRMAGPGKNQIANEVYNEMPRSKPGP